MPAPVPAYSAEFQLTIIFFMPWPVPGLHADLKRNFFFCISGRLKFIPATTYDPNGKTSTLVSIGLTYPLSVSLQKLLISLSFHSPLISFSFQSPQSGFREA